MAKQNIDINENAEINEGRINDNFTELFNKTSKASSISGGSSTAIGDNTSLASTPARLVEDVNTVRLISDMLSTRINVSGEYGHEPNMVFYNEHLYLAYMYQATGNGEGQSEGLSKVRLAKIKIPEMTIISQVIVASGGDSITVDGIERTLLFAGSPNIAVINDSVRVLMHAGLNEISNSSTVVNPYDEVILYRDYSTELEAENSLSVCDFVKNGSTHELTLSNFKANIENAGSGIQVHSQYAHVNDKYYICVGNGTSSKNGHVFSTTDFITYTWFAEAKISGIGENIGFTYEMAVYPWVDARNYVFLMLAIRRSNTTANLIVARMHTGLKYQNNTFVNGDKTAGSIEGYTTLSCCSSRPVFFSAGDSDFLSTRGKTNIFLAYDNVAQYYSNRYYTDIAFLSQNSFDASNKGRVAQCLMMTYPTIVYNGGYYYVAYQGLTNHYQSGDKQPHIFLSRFRPFTANFNKVIAGLSKIIDTFLP